MSNHTNDTHNHSHNLIFGKKTELYFAILCGVFLVAGFTIEKLTDLPTWASLISYMVSYFFGGYFIFIEALKFVFLVVVENKAANAI